MIPDSLGAVWYLLVGVLFILYAVLDGFDLGAAVWYLSAPSSERARILKLIGPFWDGNEVWLLAAGGALFAAFPPAYATVFSGFYLPVMLVVMGLILRAAAIEFRYLWDQPRWNIIWDWVFVAGSVVVPLVLGVAAGNMLTGIPLDRNGNYMGTLPELFTHYTLAAGLIAVFMFATHGSLFIAMKSRGALQERASKWTLYSWIAYLTLFIDLTIWSIGLTPHISLNFTMDHRLLWVPAIGLGTLLLIPILTRAHRYTLAFASSTLSIVAMILTFGISMHPNLVPTYGNPGTGLTIHNAASSDQTLKAMLIVAAIGLPVVFVYTTFLYRMFRGETAEDVETAQ